MRDLVYRYALNVRLGDPSACAALFVADATFETRDASPLDPAAATRRTYLEGREAIIAHIASAAGSSTRVHPSITNLLIDIDGDAASATCLMSARIWPGGGQIHGEYLDHFRFEGAWRFQSRRYTIYTPVEP